MEREPKSLVTKLLEGLSYGKSRRHFTFIHGKVTYGAQATEQTNCQLVLSPTSALRAPS